MSSTAAHGGTTPKARVRNPRGEGTRLREDLIAAARRLLDRHGQESAVTIRAVTREAGVAPQSFYLHFRNRDDLVVAVYQDAHHHLYDRLQAAARAAGDDDPERRLRAVCAAYLAYSREQPAVYQTLMGVVGEVHDWAPDELPGAATFAVLRSAVADVRRGSASGDSMVASATVWAQLHGIAALTRTRPTFPWPPTDVLLDQVIATAKA